MRLGANAQFRPKEILFRADGRDDCCGSLVPAMGMAFLDCGASGNVRRNHNSIFYLICRADRFAGSSLRQTRTNPGDETHGDIVSHGRWKAAEVLA